jgi:hypothetical protein
VPNPYHDPKNGEFTSKGGGAASSLAEGLGSAHAAKAAALHLNVTASAPSKDKPIILVYGGAFNPPHEGHADGALRPAFDALAAAGYKVDGAVVAPTADKLLAKKLGLPDRLDLEARARLARVAFPAKINGAPVTVSTEPSQEVEKATGKPRRTDLATWAQKKYPGRTIVNVTGEDAVVPGAPKEHPSLYAGAPGSNHAGFFYLTLPRDEVGGISSSKIRAAEKAGQKIPGMSAKTEQAYRGELAKHRSNIAAAFDVGHKPHK